MITRRQICGRTSVVCAPRKAVNDEDQMGNAKYFGHDGQNAGFVALMQADTETGVGAVVMANGDDGTAVVKAIMQIIAKQEGWPGH